MYLPSAVVVMPPSRNDGLPLRLTSRRNENTTSAEVSGVPSENLTFLRSWKVYVLASFEALNEAATLGSGCVTSAPLNVSRLS